MKKFLFCIIFSAASLATAESSICIANTVQNTISLDSTVTLNGIIVANPMFSELESIDNLSEDQNM